MSTNARQYNKVKLTLVESRLGFRGSVSAEALKRGELLQRMARSRCICNGFDVVVRFDLLRRVEFDGAPKRLTVTTKLYF